MYMAPLIFIVVIKVRGDSENTFAELSMEYHNFPLAQQGAEIFEFKGDLVPSAKINFFECDVLSLVKHFLWLWKAVATLKIIAGIKVGDVSESGGVDLCVEYHHFYVALQEAEIYEFKVDPMANLSFFNVMSGV